MANLAEFDHFCNKHNVKLAIFHYTESYIKLDERWSVTMTFKDDGVEIEANGRGGTLAEAAERAWSRLDGVSRNGFRFPVMLEAPSESVG